ncbi:dethiobiotin synthase [Chromobacterium subtsugae]|uniref:ATP-dependent dethiobiotin synthetase BioD n=1 Tax=Chromobacterium subtsugae TaxID=251747 RepID=A0ABS7FEW5_9NEIS|nr:MULTISPECIES: dethiobiotin synthase [Chromobacterium]KUM03859.1 dethiobiotin synthetase [Chromobacterium subtsugae]KZE87480.1 dethiobiotin synthase [Chromobacterium sp. F49]MBW7566629.1 dethiobiotin synthase [Chromobacterium subtsugae]MBW8288316.1 dethiobiotin synthase [Chromobacterium subtsugae]OBU87235.1 dethiobiotin synthetase [Chromobacterium subtsugae]
MSQGYFITGTDTEIGKTHSAVELIRHYRGQGRSVLAMKPVASGCEILPDGRWHNDDVARLTAATGQTDLELMNPYRFLPPVSPHIAARQAGVEIDLARIRQHYEQLAAQADIVLVEGAGGWLAPLTDALFMEDLARDLALPVILVVGMRLGCINHALLTARAIQGSGLALAGWVANCPQPRQAAYDENLETLKRHIPAPMLLEIPYQP